MMKRSNKLILALLIGLSIFFGEKTFAQDESSDAIITYIKTYAQLAIKEMNRTGVPASIKIAQGILETGAGKSDLVSRSNNHFGIKCKSSWTGEKVYHDDDEAGECFRKYENAEASYLDHSDYLKSQPRYSFLFNYDMNDHRSWAWGLKKAGYATSPTYAQKLITYIERYSLNELNNIASDDEEENLNAFLAQFSSSNAYTPVNNTGSENSIESEEPVKKTLLSKLHLKKHKRHHVHTVRKGDSLTSISQKYKVSIPAIKKANSMKSDRLQIGQKLKITK
ncbi:MAG: glucosaminidase domain-containing protein [bacterium]